MVLSITEPKVPVFPVPVCAWAMRSYPFSPAGIAASCMGEGSSQPISSIAFATFSAMPRSKNFEIIFHHVI